MVFHYTESTNNQAAGIIETLWTKNIYYTVIPARIRRSGARTAVCECLRAKNQIFRARTGGCLSVGRNAATPQSAFFGLFDDAEVLI